MNSDRVRKILENSYKRTAAGVWMELLGVSPEGRIGTFPSSYPLPDIPESDSAVNPSRNEVIDQLERVLDKYDK